MLPHQDLVATGWASTAKSGSLGIAAKNTANLAAPMAGCLVIPARRVTKTIGHISSDDAVARLASRGPQLLAWTELMVRLAKTGWCGTSGDADGTC